MRPLFRPVETCVARLCHQIARLAHHIERLFYRQMMRKTRYARLYRNTKPLLQEVY